MQIIKEELSSIEEVEVVRRGGGLERQLFQDYVAAEGDMERSAIMRKLAPILTKKIKTHLMSKNISTMTASDAEDIAQDEISRLADSPSMVDLEKGLPSTLLKRNALNTAIDRFRQVKKVGGTPSVSGEITAMTDTAQKAGETLPTDIMGGSRFMPQDEKVIFQDIYKKLQKEDPTAAAAFGLSYVGHTNNEIGELLGVSQPTVSRAVSKARELMTTMEESQSIEEISMNPGGYGSGVYGKTSAAARETGEKENDRQARILDELPKGHTEVPGDKLKQKPFAGKLEEIIAEVVSELMS